jgi:hypothetical protein
MNFFWKRTGEKNLSEKKNFLQTNILKSIKKSYFSIFVGRSKNNIFFFQKTYFILTNFRKELLCRLSNQSQLSPKYLDSLFLK